MATWQEYTAQIDQILGSLPPDVRASVEGYTTKDAKRDPESTRVNYNTAHQALVNSGVDPERAATILQTAYNVRRAGTIGVNDPFGDVAFKVDPAKLDSLFAASGADADGAAKADITAQMQAFVDSLLGPVPDNDPTAIAIRNQAVNASQAFAGRSGVNARSTLGAGAAAAQTSRGLAAFDFQRQQLRGQGLQMLSNRDLGLGQLQQGWEKMQMDLAGAKAEANQNQMQALGAMGGAIVGGIGGYYMGGPQGAATGMQGGSQFGAGMLGMAGGQPNYSSVGRRSGGLNPYTGR